MVLTLNTSDSNFDQSFNKLLEARREASGDVSDAVKSIIEDVRARGDEAVFELTGKFDHIDLRKAGLRITSDEIDAAHANVDRDTLDALTLAHARITSHHQRQIPRDDSYIDAIGVELGYRWSAIDAVGIYVPGGTASYPSSVLMNAVPAKVAGVPRIAMVVPTPNGETNPLILVAARLAGVDEIYRIGGAQAVAALAFGTETIAPVAKIVGPGNAYVAEAKRQVFGTVGIDMIAGPSEVLIIADKSADPAWIAADLLAQAEHDMAAQSILITDAPDFAETVCAEVEKQLEELSRNNIAKASWNNFGAVILTDTLNQAPALANQIAAEHLEIATENPDIFLSKIRNAGAIFLGHHTPEVIGDYVGGSNHVLPTARSARFSSGLGVLDFVKRTSILRLNADNLAELGPAAMALAEAEGLGAHKNSVAIRLKK